jgi:hypothetical protein
MTAFGECAYGHIQDHFNFDGDKTVDSHEKTSSAPPMDDCKLDENNALVPLPRFCQRRSVGVQFLKINKGPDRRA